MDRQPIYLDFNATTPIDPLVAESMLPFLYGHFGNPSSSHAYGLDGRRAVEEARRRVAGLLGCSAAEIVFCSGGSEANNTVLKGVAATRRSQGNEIVISAVEHPAVTEPCAALAAEGFRITVVPVDGEGRVDPAEVARAITPATILVSVMHANNEVGTIQPIAEIARITRERGVLLHTDAAQSAGKIPVDVRRLGVDFLSLAGHKLHAPKGIGALYIREGVEVPSLIHGAAHEGGRRAGTENVLEIVGLGRACELAAGRLEGTAGLCRALRDRLWAAIEASGLDVRRNGSAGEGLPNTLSVSFRGVDAATLLSEIGDSVAASAGAACHGADVDLSAVLRAMKVPVDYAMGTVRLSVGRTTTEEEIDEASRILVGAARRLSGPASPPRASAQADEEVRLTRFTRGLGCACKLRPQDLEEVLRGLPPVTDPRVLVGTATADDAAVFELGKGIAIVETVDFFTPIVDDPWEFGAISAANSLSDIYAMGAEPLFALNIVAFPTGRLPLEVLERILQGASAIASEAGIAIIGGHSVEDTEPKFGMAVTGRVDPARVLRNSGARAGDSIVLTKPLGTGIVATALKRDAAPPDLAEKALALMRRLNAAAGRAMLAHGATSCTDVTGFGLLGHLREMAAASGLDVRLDAGAVPVLDGVEELAASGFVPGGSEANLEHVGPNVDWSAGVARVRKLILADAQTSGGLLISVPERKAGDLLAALAAGGDGEARIIGAFEKAGPGWIRA